MQIKIELNTENAEDMKGLAALMEAMQGKQTKTVDVVEEVAPKKAKKAKAVEVKEVVEEKETVATQEKEKAAPKADTLSGIGQTEIREHMNPLLPKYKDELIAKIVELGSHNLASLSPDVYMEFYYYISELRAVEGL
jgi:ribosomal protein L22